MATERPFPFLPAISKWIQDTLEVHANRARPVVSFGFPRLPPYFSNDLLSTTGVVTTDRLPMPPLSAWGLPEFVSFERQPMSAITCLDTYFVEPSTAADVSVHFHEFVHVIQWQALGPKNFLLVYAAGLAGHGYMDSPLKKLAYDRQERFDSGAPSYAVDIPPLRSA